MSATEDPETQPLARWPDLVLIPVWLLQRCYVSLLPTPALLRLARLKAEVLYRFSAKRGKTLKALRRYGPASVERDHDTVVRRFFRYQEQLRIVRLWPQRPDFERLDVRIQGAGRLEQAFAGGRGVIFLTMHYGYGRLIKHVVRRQGHESWDVGVQAANAALPRRSRLAELVRDRLLRLPDFRGADHNDMPADINLRPILRALARNESIVIPVDGSKSSNNLTLPFFGQPLALAAGSVSIAAETGAVLLPAFLIDRSDDASHLELIVGQPLQIERDEAGRVLSQPPIEAFLDQAETVFEAHPHLYVWRRLRPSSKTAQKIASRYLERLDEAKIPDAAAKG